jgi:hypothetical protein
MDKEENNFQIAHPVVHKRYFLRSFRSVKHNQNKNTFTLYPLVFTATRFGR